ncbi:MAG: endonuclease/exonuclease/phosphatase family protein [Oscillospiraceae bacterium]|nr:endonuclease/exonuclease/phosphatase family protein [Oscillospiraceae bacterium]MBR6678141.1 endonuclease/exonuclease/phosphatase family protein [Oscillospiraceae bacterium]
MKRGKKILLGAVATVLLVVCAYVIYVLVDYHRIGNHVIAVSGEGETAQVGTPYSVISYNIGFAAYTPDFGFFMDGGTESRAASKESVERVTGEIADFLQAQDADFLMVQEVDVDATRSHHVDECARLRWALEDYGTVFALNYDSPYLFYPILEPHGKSTAGMLTASRFAMIDARRVELPIEENFYKFLDLDRCYTICRVPVENGRELVLYTVHLSAYTSDGTVATEQLQQLLEDMQGEYEAGNYVVCGGDFNKDMLGDSSAVFGVSGEEYTWAQPLPTELMAGTGIRVPEYDLEHPVPSCRNADAPYHEGQFVLTVDGFLVSENVETEPVRVLDTGFAWSDHNPVELRFTLMD